MGTFAPSDYRLLLVSLLASILEMETLLTAQSKLLT